MGITSVQELLVLTDSCAVEQGPGTVGSAPDLEELTGQLAGESTCTQGTHTTSRFQV